MNRALRRVLACAIACALPLTLAAGCSETPPVAPVSPPPPSNVRAVVPPARATGVIYDSDIAIEFIPAIDARTIDSTTVYVKLDLARYPATLNYDAATHVLHIVPRFSVRLLRTYTIEITPRVLTTTGVPVIPGGYFWQFTTNSVRRPDPLAPVDGITFESPHARLGWDSTDTAIGAVNYDVYVSADSMALVAHTVPRLARVTTPFYVPPVPWGFEARVYWSVDATNATSGETLRGPVARFATLPASTPIDSLIAPLDKWGYFRRTTGQTFCGPGSTPCNGTGDFNSVMDWLYPASPQPLLLARVELQLQANTQSWAARRPAVYVTRQKWSGCSSLSGINPQTETTSELALGSPGFGLDWVKFKSEYFTAWVEANARYHDTGSFQLYTTTLMNFGTSIPTDPFRGAMKLYYYKLPPAAAASRSR